MCGIAGLHIKNPKVVRSEEAINLVVDKLLLGIEHRGKHATGFVAVTDDKQVMVDKTAIEATEFIKDRDRIPENVRTILLHTRYSTKGSPENTGNNHPVIYKSCFTIHNGSIGNDDDLFREFGLKRNYEVDTEVIPALLDKFGLGDMEHIKEALTKFRGPLAIATIDPVNHPHKVLLAKGTQSPLVIFENDNMIMWASEVAPMRDAWGAVYGTPPKHEKFKYMMEGDIIVIDGAEVTRDRYTVAAPFVRQVAYDRQWNGTNGEANRAWKRRQQAAKDRQELIRRSGSTSGTSGAAPLWGSHDSLFPTEKMFVNAVAWYREQGHGNARIWPNRDKLDDARDFSDVPEGQSVSWVPCKCGIAVLAQDIRKHLKYGNVCVDCYVVIREAYDKKVKPAQSVGEAAAQGRHLYALPSGGSEDEPKYREVDDTDRANMESWASVEAKAHRLILAAVAMDSGYSENLIDFLVFRTGAMVADFGVSMKDLKTQLTRAYEAFTPEVWEAHGAELLNDIVKEDGGSNPEDWDSSYSESYTAYTVTKNGGLSEVWYTCHTHNENFRSGDDCPTCIKVEDAIEQVMQKAVRDKAQCDECGLEFPQYQMIKYQKHGDDFLFCPECNHYFADPCEVQDKQEKEAEENAKLQGLARCPACHTFISNKYPCKVCEVRATEEPEPVPIERLVNINPEVKQRCKGVTNKGRPCRRKVAFCVGNIGAYCTRHFQSCSHARCTKDANTILVDGQRVCHGHARGQAGSLADARLASSGVVFQEVRG